MPDSSPPKLFDIDWSAVKPPPVRVVRRKMTDRCEMVLDEHGRVVIFLSEKLSKQEQAVLLWKQVIRLLMMAGGRIDDTELSRVSREMAESFPHISRWTKP
jgi:hypothetical protein